MAAIDLGPARPRRRLVSLTPLIDVVFLLLIFFMLAARFSVESE
ncbi:MAG: biopolymer transporter ExbD, partial [Pseudomonadota bacterium]